MVPEDRKAFVEQCWQDLTRETITDAWHVWCQIQVCKVLVKQQEAAAKA